MIKITEMWWSDCFSYGPDNYIDFSSSSLVQLIGKNGHGKTSISLVLEEGLYNKNSKGIKKSDILNRYSNSKFYTIKVHFIKDDVLYEVSTKRGSTQTVTLVADGVDISSHTATSTYKQIEELLGMDHKTFAQIVVQSSVSSLEFLTSTDSTRKKFLIDLLNLNKYIELGEEFKVKAKAAELAVTGVTAKINSTNFWIEKHKDFDFSVKDLKPVPDSLAVIELTQRINSIKSNIANILAINKKIIQNNEYKKLLDSFNVSEPGQPPDTSALPELTKSKIEQQMVIKDANAFITKMRSLGTTCPTCLQSIDAAKVSSLVAEKNELVALAKEVTTNCDTHINELNALEKEWKAKTKVLAEYENYHSLYDKTLSDKVLDKDVLDSELRALEQEVAAQQKHAKEIEQYNMSASAHNAKVEVVAQQLKEFRDELKVLNAQLASDSKHLSNLQVLVKTFSPSGLVAYKIECMIKDLESLTNMYLAELSGGRFQLTFKINGSDKLNVVITDNGNDIDITALSSGEKARVNVATLLGIRKMLESLSNNRINLLVLDETAENLDSDGKEKLVEVLLAEDQLNTILVSHSFTHPLIEKISIVKENNISRIE